MYCEWSKFGLLLQNKLFSVFFTMWLLPVVLLFPQVTVIFAKSTHVCAHLWANVFYSNALVFILLWFLYFAERKFLSRIDLMAFIRCRPLLFLWHVRPGWWCIVQHVAELLFSRWIVLHSCSFVKPYHCKDSPNQDQGNCDEIDSLDA